MSHGAEGTSMLTSRTGKTKGGKEFLTFAKKDATVGGCSENRCIAPGDQSPAERKETKAWKREDANFYRKARYSAKQAGVKLDVGFLGWKSGEAMNY
jgi:hypothetical protein